MTQAKADLRRHVLARRDSLDPTERSDASARIAAAVIARSEFQTARAILLYWSMRSEVDTRAIAAAAHDAGQRIALPHVDWASHTLTPVWLPGDAALEPGRFGVPELPAHLREAAGLEELDLVLVPGAAFDTRGYRLGYGGGFYDRLLAGPLYGRVAWGLAFEAQVLDSLPAEPHDVAMSALVTELGWRPAERSDA